MAILEGAPRRVAKRLGIQSSQVGLLAVACAVVGWGFNNVIVKIVAVPAITFTFWRIWIGAAAMFVVLSLAGRRLTWQALKASAPGGVLLGIEMICFFFGLKLTSVVDVTMIAALQPALTLLVAGPLFAEIVTRREISWTAVSVVGVVLVAVGSSGTPVWSLRGDLLAVASLLAWTAYFIVSKRTRAAVPALEYMTAVTLVAGLVATPFALVSGQPLGALTVSDVAWLCLFALGGSGGHLLLAWAHPRVDVKVSALMMLGLPVFSGLAAFLVLHEPLTLLEILGGLIVIASVAAIVVRATRAGAGEEIAADAPG